MSHDHLIVGAVTATIGAERGVAAVVVTDATGTLDTTAHLAAYRSAGVALEMLGVLKAMLAATVNRDPSRVTVHASADLVAAIEAHLADGSIRIPETLHTLTSIARIHRVKSARGVTFAFVVGRTELSAEHQAAFAELVTGEQQAHEAKHAAGWQLPEAYAAWVEENQATVVYTDGSHMTTTGFGAWAWWVDEDRYASGTSAACTSTYAERLAIYEALRVNRGPVLVVTDLAHVLPNGRGRTVSGGHRRLLGKLRHELARPDVRVLCVKGHDTCVGNQAADRLAGQALASVWSRLCAQPVLAKRLVALHQEQQHRVAAMRVIANERWQRRYEQYQARQAKLAAATAAA